ncbi:glycerol-3-phosphate dehydrogenase/oxidase [Austwickia chelonae]|uniref:glycerol-3-phosphate dehydrogenase/oxidase n=1 Tax=Austwickia chelonae TaxID=100225 RepID=UPI000E285182|nr:glycerol-3-phosphate dehydrogenase/oxidase [Austwickia chelonae]
MTDPLRSPADLTPASRLRALERVADGRYDVIVVGGGVTGAGVALDAASRGLRTALVEKVDIAAGTSRWSSKLVHGGLRYLAKGDIAVAWESSVERHHLMTTIAPHLTRSAQYLVPFDQNTGPAMGALAEVGIRFADLMRLAARTPGALLPAPHRLGPAGTMCLAPGLRREGLRGSLVYTDGQLEDDARLVVALTRTAAAHGADIITRCRAENLRDDRLTLVDELTGQRLEGRGVVVSATGVWADEHAPDLRIAPSRGSHIVVRASAVGHPRVIFTAPVPGHFGRYVFAMPQTDGLVIIGLTDEPTAGVDGIAPPVPVEDETFLLSTINSTLNTPLTSADVVGRFAGLRPLVLPASGGQGATADVSRRHLLIDAPGQPITIAGGKLTTYRLMAEQTVDAVSGRLRRETVSRTRQLPLIGAADRSLLNRLPYERRLVRRYGTEAVRVAELASRHPQLATPVAEGVPTTGAEMLFGALCEGALQTDDLVERRTRVSFVEEAVPAATEAARQVLELAAELGQARPRSLKE